MVNGESCSGAGLLRFEISFHSPADPWRLNITSKLIELRYKDQCRVPDCGLCSVTECRNGGALDLGRYEINHVVKLVAAKAVSAPPSASMGPARLVRARNQGCGLEKDAVSCSAERHRSRPEVGEAHTQ